MEIRFATDPSTSAAYTTEQRRAAYLVENLFPAGGVRAVYSHQDRIVVGGVSPASGRPVSLGTFDPLRSEHFCDRRELGVVNIGGPGTVTVDGKEFPLDNKDVLYIGQGSQDVVFASEGAAKYYLMSAAAHAAHPTTLVRHDEVEPVVIGAQETSNDRRIYKYIHADGVRSCQLVLGITVLRPGSMWNTMPCHLHDRRTEVYCYFDLDPEHRIVHLMGRPDETRNLIVQNEQAVISPSWSVHTGVGTSSYGFVWGMAGENQAFDDMDHVAIPSMR